MKRHIFGILLGLLACLGLISLRLSDPPVMASLRASGFDTLQRLWPRASPPQPVRVVAIDEAALAKLGQWPWPRDRLATLVENLTSLGAQAIVFDILFAEPDRSSPSQLVQDPAVKAMLSTQPGQDLPDHDKAFAAAIAKAPVVLAASALPAASATGPQPKAGFAVTGQEVQTGLPVMEGLVGNLPALDAAARGLGVINIDLAGNGGVVRALPLLWRGGEKPFPSLALEALRVAQGQQTVVVNGSPTLAGAVNSIRVGQIEIPTAEQGALAVYYHHDDTNLYVSAAQLLDPTQLASLRPLIEGHIVLVGATATGLLDTRVSSLGESLPGVAVHAQALEQVLSGQFLSRPEWVADFEMVLVAAAGLAFSILAGLWRPLPLIGTLLATLAALAGLTSWFFLTQNLLFDFTYPFTALVAVFLVTLAFKLLVTERHGRALRTAFSHYVASPVLEQIERNPQTLKLGGEQREVTVMFADIKNFTPLTEKLPPKELVSCVNRILQASTAAILARNGTLDKYIGDAVMAFWNAPVEMQDHQYQAALAALDIHKAVAALNADPLFAAPLKARNLWPISLRIGLASGPATVGNMGSRDRFDYSVLGETVNTAARAEAACKEVAADTLLAGALIGKSATLATLDAGKRQFRGAGQLRQCHAIFSAEKDEEHRLADMTLYGFQSGTRMIQPPHGEAYARFFAALPQRRADYGMK